MDENNAVSFSCEPDNSEDSEAHTSQNSNYYYDPNFQPRPNPQPEPEKPKKQGKGTWKIVALLLVVAILGSVGGSALTAAIAGIRQPSEEAQDTLGNAEDLEDESQYELVVHQLPAQLNSNDTGKTLTLSQVYEMAVNSVVGINTETTTNIYGQEAVAASSGSGFILSEDGYVITNCHVVDGANSIQVTLYSGETYDAELVGSDSDYDVAVLKIEAEGLPTVSVGDSSKLKVGEEVVAIGNPLGELTFTMTNGIISALDREINTDGNPQNMIQTNAAINSGNSGGPLFDMDGNVVGVTSAKYSGSTSSGTTIEGLGFAIPINDVLKVAYDLVDYGYVRGLAYLGVVVRTLDEQTADYYGLPVGPRVESVSEGSCAEKAGIQAGDIIFRFNGVDVTTNTELQSQLKKVSAGDTVNVMVYRSGSELELTVTLDERPQDVPDPNETVQEEQNGYTYPTPDDGYDDYFTNPFGFGFGG